MYGWWWDRLELDALIGRWRKEEERIDFIEGEGWEDREMNMVIMPEYS